MLKSNDPQNVTDLQRSDVAYYMDVVGSVHTVQVYVVRNVEGTREVLIRAPDLSDDGLWIPLTYPCPLTTVTRWGMPVWIDRSPPSGDATDAARYRLLRVSGAAVQGEFRRFSELDDWVDEERKRRGSP